MSFVVGCYINYIVGFIVYAMHIIFKLNEKSKLYYHMILYASKKFLRSLKITKIRKVHRMLILNL